MKSELLTADNAILREGKPIMWMENRKQNCFLRRKERQLWSGDSFVIVMGSLAMIATNHINCLKRGKILRDGSQITV